MTPKNDSYHRRRARPRPVDDFDVMTSLAVYVPGPNA
jgi:hypothetical protein